ncbi:MAG: ACT domain-containing protein [Deltaproteobacteria bacterium]|nr:ACT domain-containing protein [Deltaproteobacteria bacterium]
MKKWIAVSIGGRDRPGIVANVSRVLYHNRCNIEDLSQTAIRGQFAMILIASVPTEEGGGGLKEDLAGLAGDLALDIRLREIDEPEMSPYDPGDAEPFVITVRGEDRPGLVYGITEILAEQGINITHLDAEVARIGGQLEYIQVYQVDLPRKVDLAHLQEKLRERGQDMGVKVDLQHRDIFRAINQI